ncbi:hypothetical protein bAD24_III10715 [Burkholderia sp. AD24]|nr:hypothetical protein bAD24_III10715 [Burkholderia sp. AD24]
MICVQPWTSSVEQKGGVRTKRLPLLGENAILTEIRLPQYNQC